MDQLMNASDRPCVNFKNPVNLMDAVNNGLTFEINYSDFKDEDKLCYDPEEVVNHLNFDCLDIADEDNYDASSPFSSIATKMENIVPDGAVKKRILRQGIGEVVPEDALVYIHYNAYLEYNEEPFDSTYINKRFKRFQLLHDPIISGLEIGIQTMKAQEKAQFLIIPEYAYGKTGCLKRIPPDSTVLFEVELVKFVNSGAAMNDESTNFNDVYKKSIALCEKGNDLVRNCQNYKMAIREYNRAATLLENCEFTDYTQQEKAQEQLVRLYTNLAVSYLKHNVPRKCCTNCNKIYHMVRDTNMSVPAKVYYSNSKALIMLNDLNMAEVRLRQAAAKKRDDPDIVRLFLLLNDLKEKQLQQEQKLAKVLLGLDNEDVSEDFKKYVVEMLEEFKENVNILETKLPPKLNDKELEFIKVRAVNHGFSVRENESGKGAYSIVKSVEHN